jgi:predicted nucleic acid-binding protein
MIQKLFASRSQNSWSARVSRAGSARSLARGGSMARTGSRIALVDTSVYVELVRHGRFQDELIALPNLIRNSAVVLSELRRGATLPRERRWIDELEAQHEVFFPGTWEWRRSGEVLERLRKKRGYDAKKLRDLHFDALIALTARAVGALVITCNGEDFEALRTEEPFELLVWSGA